MLAALMQKAFASNAPPTPVVGMLLQIRVAHRQQEIHEAWRPAHTLGRTGALACQVDRPTGSRVNRLRPSITSLDVTSSVRQSGSKFADGFAFNRSSPFSLQPRLRLWLPRGNEKNTNRGREDIHNRIKRICSGLVAKTWYMDPRFRKDICYAKALSV